MGESSMAVGKLDIQLAGPEGPYRPDRNMHSDAGRLHAVVANASIFSINRGLSKAERKRVLETRPQR